MEFPHLLLPSRYLPPLNSYEVRLFFPHCYSTSYTRYNILDETTWRLSMYVNEWLTENCVAQWGFYVHLCLSFDQPFAIISEKMIEVCKPYIAFESKNDALLFKLAM